LASGVGNLYSGRKRHLALSRGRWRVRHAALGRQPGGAPGLSPGRARRPTPTMTRCFPSPAARADVANW
jgi:hypothetical protein